MKFARLRFRFPDGPLSPVQAALTGCEGFDGARLRFGGVAASGPRTYVLSVAGDSRAVADALAAEPGVIDCELVSAADRRGLIYVRAEASEVELALRETFAQGSLVTTLPVDFGPDGDVVFRVLGEQSDLGEAVAEVREVLPVTVERVGEYDGQRERVDAGLTERQTEALRAALDLGYYDVPRAATHEDVAEALDCAPSTASEHLRKAEAALVRSAFA